ncbi:MAG: Ig-like domain-containing protein [Bacteroidales bacterium]|nr:Ig-like domain-containing protein [Bacteroidales bacterium]
MPLNLKLKNRQNLVISYTPDNTSRKGVTWSSSNTSIATVDATGMVTAKTTEGMTWVYATSEDGIHKDSCVVEVKKVSELFNRNSAPVSIYPNPARDRLILSGFGNEISIMRILDITGK